MSTFREFAAKLIEQTRDELQADGLVDDKAGVLAGAMVDAATIAVQEWLRQPETVDLIPYEPLLDPDLVTRDLVHEAGRVTPDHGSGACPTCGCDCGRPHSMACACSCYPRPSLDRRRKPTGKVTP